ncbi:mandelate racemase/muconate lactonizing enzyme family protein [Streptomyces tubercidicus]
MKIIEAAAYLVDVAVETERTDAVQAFLKQETIFVELRTDDGSIGTGYSYTIDTGGMSVPAMLRGHLLPRLFGQDARMIEQIWFDLLASTRATTVGAITSQSAGWPGVKLKVGKPRVQEDLERLNAVRDAVGPGLDIMVDANQSMTCAEARRRAAAFEPVGLSWFEEPLPADDIEGHVALARSTPIPIAVGESMYSASQFREYLQRGTASIIQVDAARIGGITPWLKVAHLAETFNVHVCPHFRMELHVLLVAAIPNGRYVEHIPQLRAITRDELIVQDGHALAPDVAELGIDWDAEAVDDRRVA